MYVYLVWATGSPADSEVIAVFENKEKAEGFISNNPEKHVTGTWKLDSDDFTIEERELNKPINIEF